MDSFDPGTFGVWEAVFGAAGMIVVGVLTFLGTRLSARQSAKAAAETAAVSSRQVDVEEWRSIVEGLQSEVTRLSARVESLESKDDERRAQIESLQAELASKDARHRSLIAYVRDVLLWASRLIPDQTPPVPPSLFAAELDLRKE